VVLFGTVPLSGILFSVSHAGFPGTLRMLIHPYQLEELQFGWCYRVYYRWQTHRVRPQPALRRLDRETLDVMLQPYGIHILEASSGETDVKVLVSLLPTETVAACAGKMKGRVSKWLREQHDLRQPPREKLLSRGYFAGTTGKSTADAVNQYLDDQGEHHGYASRVRPPAFVQRYPLTSADEQRLSANHAVTVLQFHVVLATWKRKGVFGQAAAEATADGWRRMEAQHQMVIEKVSFVPDHAHVAVRTHPSQSPAEIVLALMNSSQERMWSDFSDSVIRAGVERLWQASAYIGSYGDLESTKIGAYVRRWEQDEGL
jgi:REP element-mobilizing transposase RayT